MSFGLDQATFERIAAVFERFPEVDRVLIYGSRAKGTFRNGSDIDLTLLGTNLTEAILTAIKLALDDLNTPYLFDVSIFEQLHSPDLQSHIARVGRLFYQSASR